MFPQARHGTRAPTKKRIEELNNLENELKKLLGDDVGIIDLSLHQVPSWLKKWKSPWSEKVNGGELILEGEEELYDLGIRTKKLFPDLLSDDYHPNVYTIKATQVIFTFHIVICLSCSSRVTIFNFIFVIIKNLSSSFEI